MSNELPQEYKKKIRLDTRIRSIGTVKSVSDKIPSEIKTVEDLFVKRKPITQDFCNKIGINDYTLSDGVRLDITPEEIPDPKIKTYEDMILTYFSLFVNYNTLYSNSEEESDIISTFGEDIKSVDDPHNILLLSRDSNLPPMNFSNDLKPIKNVCICEGEDTYDRYILTNCSKREVLNADINGIENDQDVVIVKSQYVHFVKEVLNYDTLEQLFENSYIRMNRLFEGRNPDLDLYVAVAPLILDAVKKPWRYSEKLSNATLIDRDNWTN